MNLSVGMSGYSYKEWKGIFYPEDLPAKEMLRYYATRLSSVELNNTFYRLPRASVLQGWAEQVPESFRFAVKASRRITHLKRLKNTDSEVEYLFRTLEVLQDQLGVVLFQLPPSIPRDDERLKKFLGLLPAGFRTTFEFRHATWVDPAVDQILRDHGSALCVAEGEKERLETISATANFGYLRLRRQDYTDEDLQSWADRIAAQSWEEAFVFFKHEDEETGPDAAERFRKIAGDSF